MTTTPDTLIEPGRYRHFKGSEYEVIGAARHTETGEAFVVYRGGDGGSLLWVRPWSSFAGVVVIDGTAVPRFERVEE